jgi:predicted RNA binding protein YcfA (HicA-like mRNA interferase family)
LRLLYDDGWYLVATKGSHRQFKLRQNLAGSRLLANPAMILPPGPSAAF